MGGTGGKGPNIVIIDESPVRAAILEDGLREAGYQRITLIAEGCPEAGDRPVLLGIGRVFARAVSGAESEPRQSRTA